MTSRNLTIDQTLQDYITAHSGVDPLVAELIAETRAATGGAAGMQISPEQAVFTTTLARLLGARSAVEVGTFTGMSALAIARGLPEDGHLLCCDVSEEWTNIGRKYWERAGVADRIELRIAPAAETLAALPADATVDLAFIDADKTGYPTYWAELVPRMRPGGVILVDNTLWSGRVVDPADTSADTVAIRAFNELVTGDDRVESVILPIGDGLTLARKK
ncbi:SAM-dependent methyltransferase [Longispora fulva]|uniref:Caffeoyl-CoA O-methyltransferase n=1 Tax=Longispora fulva TaxID=619741 RepID=A0A8J7GTW7_9ACTN|nr:class I SAM-dependent methyltransferase [Longispora fulva]MBG6137191.1 caffeoyl-CoA O-methyltransferase [Longispora fulva]GIG61455.1 SAM-dependent methyltransferase [Longispora fulva]